jgi:hypothetical protein
MVCPLRAEANVIMVEGSPATHSPDAAPEAVPLLADAAASGRVQTPSSATTSATLVTVIVVPAACIDGAGAPTRPTRASASSATRMMRRDPRIIVLLGFPQPTCAMRGGAARLERPQAWGRVGPGVT